MEICATYQLTVRDEYLVVGEFTIHFLLLSVPSYLHKSAFSALTYITSEYCKCLEDVTGDLTVGSRATVVVVVVGE